jgi:hypothetical protein
MQIRALLTFALLLALAVLGVRQLGPPAPVAADAPAQEFSSARAFQHLPHFAREPRPIGSAANARVRSYLLGQLEAMGLDPEVQTTFASHLVFGRRYSGTPSNVLVRLEGTASSGTVLLSAHYDSVPESPGAADNGAAVAALLEVLRALTSGPALQNDLVFLFDDGEEDLLLGARAFVEDHPWAEDVALVLNFDARGSSGPSWMFRTSNGSRWLIGEFASAAPLPATSSLLPALFAMAPGLVTNLDVFEDAGITAMDFAFAGSPANYHTRFDSIERLDERSLQHHGSYALALARHFGSLGLAPQVEAELVYFSLLGRVVIYPASWSMPMATGVAVLFGVVAGIGLRRRRLNLAGILTGALAVAVGGAATAGLVALSYLIVTGLAGDAAENHLGVPWNSDLYALSFISLAVAVTSLTHLGFRRRATLADLTLGGALWWVLLAILISRYLPAAGYLATWPALFALLALAPSTLLRDPQPTPARVAALLLPPVSGMLLVIPALYALFIFAPVAESQLAYPAVSLVVVLLLGLLVPHLATMAPRGRGEWVLPAVAAIAAMALLIAAGVSAIEEHGQPVASGNPLTLECMPS